MLLVWFYLFLLPCHPPSPCQRAAGIRDRYLDFVGIYVARVFVDNLFHKKVFFWWGGGGTCIHLAVVAGGAQIWIFPFFFLCPMHLLLISFGI